jgi:hypothetical protein
LSDQVWHIHRPASTSKDIKETWEPPVGLRGQILTRLADYVDMQAVRDVEVARGDPGTGARNWVRAVIALVLAAVLAGAVVVVYHEQARSRGQVVQRFVLRAQLASSFVDTYVPVDGP